MRPFTTLFFVILTCTGMPARAQTKYSRVKINIPSRGLSWLQDQGVDFDHGEINRDDNTFTTTISSDDIAKLRASGTYFTVLIDDEAAHFSKNNNKEDFYRPSVQLLKNGKLHFENSCSSEINSIATPAGFIAGSYGGYYTFSEMQERIDDLVASYPSLVQKIVLPATTAGGNPLIVVKISDNASADENEPEAFYTGLHHAREGMSMMNLFFFMYYLVENYSSDQRIHDLVDNRELFFLPCTNPDGYLYNESSTPGGGGMWRKNRRNSGGGIFGVDLNRNYSVDWGVTGPNINISTNPSSDSYIGPSAFSEPETQAIRAFAQTRNFSIAIDHHAYGNYYVTPYGVPAAHPFTQQDEYFYRYASALMARYNGYFAGDGMATVNYYAVGNSRDYHISGDIGIGTKQKTYGYTVEIGPSSYGFWPSAGNIIPIARSMVFSNLQMAYMAGSYFELQDMDPVSLTGLSGSFNFSLRRIGLTDAPVTISIEPLSNIQSVGAPVTISSMANYFDSVQRNIPYTISSSTMAGSLVKYVYEISSGNIVLRDTIEKLYQPTIIFSDDMEAAAGTNWTLTGNWENSTIHAYTGNSSLSESPSGNYGLNENSSATCKTVIDLSDATAAYLSFWVKHRAQNGYDKLQVQISTNGTGAFANFQPVCGANTIMENTGTIGNKPAFTGIRENWTRETIDLSSFLGNSNIGLRFAFTSNGSETDDGFYIDNVEIVKSIAGLLSAGGIDIKAKRVPEGALIEWKAGNSAFADRFEIESSLNGKDFVVIGSVINGASVFLDRTANTDRFFRIHMISLKGRSEFSKSVFLPGIKQQELTVFPNPVERQLSVRLNMQKAGPVILIITDLSGRKFSEKTIQVSKGTNYATVDMSRFPPQAYILKTRELNTGTGSIYKIIKQYSYSSQ
jgi:carboxypeptidase T